MPSKLCPHSLGDHPDVRLLAEAGCRGVKLAGRLDIAADLLTARADLILLGRVDSPYDPLAAQRAGVEPEAAVREFVAGQQEQYRRNPLIRIWEGPAMPGQSDGSWRDHLDFWSQHDGARDPIDYWRGAQNGAERDPERYYAEQLIWYDRELQKDDYVVGAAVFSFAADESRKPY